MPRHTNRPYSIRALEQLTRGLLFTPADKRPQQVRRAERLHDEIDPNINYPLEYITWRITHFRSTYDDHPLLVGLAILPDLRQMIDQLSRSTDLTTHPDDDQTYLTPQQLAQQWGVSTKTISRYRADGLRWRWILNPTTGRRIVVYPSNAVAHFTTVHRDAITHASRYAYINDATRQRIIDRARRITQAHGATMHRVAAHLAKRMGPSLDTVRKILDAHDRQYHDHPDQAVFANRSHPLTARQKLFVQRAARWKIPVARIARHLGHTRSSIHRLINQQHATKFQRIPIHYHILPIFKHHDADTIILAGDIPMPDINIHQPRTLDDLPTSLQPIYANKTYDPTAAQTVFVRMHYHRYRADTLRDHLHPDHPRTGELQTIEHHLQQADHCREKLILAHLSLVLTATRQHRVGANQPLHLIDLIEIGHPVLYHAVDTFDPSRGRDFRSFLNFELQRRFAQLDSRIARKRESDQIIATRIHLDALSNGITLPNT